MLDKIRNIAKSWVAGIFVALLVLSFAIWGIGDIFRGGGTQNVAEIGDEAITVNEFEDEFERLVQRLRAQTNGAFDSAQARQMGFDRQVLYDLVQRRVLDAMAARLGLSVSDEELARTIRSNPDFSGTLGNFSKETYTELLRRNGFTPTSYEDRLRDDLVRGQLLQIITGGLTMPTPMAEAMYAFRNEKREVAYLVLPPETVPPAEEPSAEDIQAFYDENAVQFTLPELRTFTLVQVEPGPFEDRIEVDEADLRELYDFNLAAYQEPERRTVEVIPFLTSEDALAAYEALSAADEAEAALAQILADKDLSDADITRTSVAQRDMFDAVVAEAAFGIDAGVFSEPINGDLGWAIVRVGDIKPGHTKSFEEVRDELRKEKVGANAKDEMFKAVEALQDEIASGTPLAEAASQVGLDAQNFGPIDSSGKTREGRQVQGLPDIPTLLSTVFSTEPGFESDFEETGTDGYYIVRVSDIIDPRAQSLEEATPDVIAGLKQEQRRKALRDVAEKIAERGNNGESFETLAAEFGKSVLKTPEPITRETQDEIFSASFAELLFSNRIGDFVARPANFGDGYVVASVTDIFEANPAAAQSEVAQLRTVLTRSVESDLAAQYLGYAEKKLDIKTYESVIAQSSGAGS